MFIERSRKNDIWVADSEDSAVYKFIRKFYEMKPLGINWDVCRNDYPNTGVEANNGLFDKMHDYCRIC
jgi:hypothetical protein